MASTNQHDNDTGSDAAEQRVLYAALDSFRQYRQAAHYNITHLRRQAFYSLPSAHTDVLCEPPFVLPDTFRLVDDAIDANAEIAEAILAYGLAAFGVDGESKDWHGAATASDNDKARSTVRQIYREWSSEGEVERRACFDPILAALRQHLPVSNELIHVLVPGAGLGRLVIDLCLAGYAVEGNEISYHQLLTSNYLLNCTSAAEQHTLYPWALGFGNHHTRADQLRSVKIPDVHPGTALEAQAARQPQAPHYSERMSMLAGDFCVVYKQEEYENHFDAVTTCFFIDTAPNLIKYVETVKSCLKAGGIWVNLGPLLWHFEGKSPPEAHSSQDDAGIGEPGSFELANDEVLALLKHFGFKIETAGSNVGGASGYIQDPRSMLQHIYKPFFWVARKE